MAADTQARMQYSLIDERGIKGSFQVPMFVDGAQTLTQAKAAWNTYGALLDAVTGAKIQHGSVVVLPSITYTPKSPDPAVGSELEEVGNLDFANASTRYVYDVAIPSVADACLTSPPVAINEAQTDMAAFIAATLAAVLGGHFTNNSYLTLSALADSFLSSRKHRRRLHQVSLRTP